MSDPWQLTPPSPALKVADAVGDMVTVSAQSDGTVGIGVTCGAVFLDAAQQEEFARAYVAKCFEAKALADAREQAREEALDAAEMAADRRAYFDID